MPLFSLAFHKTCYVGCLTLPLQVRVAKLWAVGKSIQENVHRCVIAEWMGLGFGRLSNRFISFFCTHTPFLRRLTILDVIFLAPCHGRTLQQTEDTSVQIERLCMQLHNISQCMHCLIVERKNSLRVPYSKSFELLYYCQRKIYVLVFGRLLLKRIIHINSSLAVFEGITQIFSKFHGAEHNFSNAMHLSSSSICLYYRLTSKIYFIFPKSSFAYFVRWL